MKTTKLIGMVVAVLLLLVSTSVAENQVILLWPNGAPGSEGKNGDESVRVTDAGEHVVSNVHRPSITVYLPAKDKATGAAVVVAPGGGHRELWMDHEGYNVAKYLSERGVAAFVLKYRLARADGSTYTVEGTELSDIKRAIRTVKNRATEWGVDPDRIGVMGFSAGGEIAALASTQFDSGTAGATDLIEREKSKPAFQCLIYPGGSHAWNFSKETPPAFLVCGEDDRPDIAQGVAEMYVAMKRAGISTELHIFAHTPTASASEPATARQRPTGRSSLLSGWMFKEC